MRKEGKRETMSTTGEDKQQVVSKTNKLNRVDVDHDNKSWEERKLQEGGVHVNTRMAETGKERVRMLARAWLGVMSVRGGANVELSVADDNSIKQCIYL